MKLPANKGLCLSCKDKNECVVSGILKEHKKNIKAYGKNYESVRPDLWEEFAIDEPEVKNKEVVWCPLYFNGKMRK